MMRPVFFSSLLGLLLATTALADEAAIKQSIAAYADAFNKQDLETVIGYWSQNGVHVDRETGERTEGREAIKADLAGTFEASQGATLAGRVNRVRMVKPDVAHVDGEVVLSLPGENPTSTIFSAILVNQNGKWMIDTIEESPAPVPSDNYEALAELDWMLGEWVDDGGDIQVNTKVSWAANGAFMLRSFVVTTADDLVRQGTEVIGWDPRSGEIRSWSFQSDGSFGDGTWSKNGEDWIVKASQTLPDGRAASGTYIFSKQGDDQISVRLIGHMIEGEPQPSGEGTTLKRVAEDSVAAQAVESNAAVSN
jgi:uncharacterized protein (TIGR02246 family)